jgi:hypothetical protein
MSSEQREEEEKKGQERGAENDECSLSFLTSNF